MIGWVVSTYMAIQAITTLVGGYIGDRMPIHLAVSGFAMVQALSVFVLVFLANSPATAILFAIVLGLAQGGVALTMSIWSVYYDRRAFARVTGMAMMPLSFGLFRCSSVRRLHVRCNRELRRSVPDRRNPRFDWVQPLSLFGCPTLPKNSRGGGRPEIGSLDNHQLFS